MRIRVSCDKKVIHCHVNEGDRSASADAPNERDAPNQVIALALAAMIAEQGFAMQREEIRRIRAGIASARYNLSLEAEPVADVADVAETEKPKAPKKPK